MGKPVIYFRNKLQLLLKEIRTHLGNFLIASLVFYTIYFLSTEYHTVILNNAISSAKENIENQVERLNQRFCGGEKTSYHQEDIRNYLDHHNVQHGE